MPDSTPRRPPARRPARPIRRPRFRRPVAGRAHQRRAARRGGELAAQGVYTGGHVWAFLAQVLNPDRSCRAAVRPRPGRAHRHRAAALAGRPPGVLQGPRPARRGGARRLARDAGRGLHRRPRPAGCGTGGGQGGGRHHPVDAGHAGNQREYPQPAAQKPGLGFPIVRAVVVFCLATGAVLDAALGRYCGKRPGRRPAAAVSGCVRGGRRGARGPHVSAGSTSWRSGSRAGGRGGPAAPRAADRLPHRAPPGRRGPRGGVAKPDRPPWVDDELFAALPRKLSCERWGCG